MKGKPYGFIRLDTDGSVLYGGEGMTFPTAVRMFNEHADPTVRGVYVRDGNNTIVIDARKEGEK